MKIKNKPEIKESDLHSVLYDFLVKENLIEKYLEKVNSSEYFIERFRQLSLVHSFYVLKKGYDEEWWRNWDMIENKFFIYLDENYK